MVIPYHEDIGPIASDGYLDPNAYWHATILDIRGKGTEPDIVSFLSMNQPSWLTITKTWLQIRWFYTINHIKASLGKKTKPL